MKKLKNFLSFVMIVVFSVSCKEKTIENTNAVWLWSTHMKDAPLQEWVDKGIGHVLLNEAAFWKYDREDVLAFAQNCKDHGIKPHVWFQCFGRNKQWTFPVDEQAKTLKQEYLDDMVQRAEDYLKAGFEGIHLDYIRFCGNAHKFNFPETGLTGVGIITESCRQMYVAVKAINPDAILSAALMPEIDSEYRYGQRPSEMSKWLDVLMPMIYRYDYYGEDKSIDWVSGLTRWFVENKGGAQVWVGIQTYNVNLEDKTPVPLDADAILKECNIIKAAGADGVVFFRHGLGTLPDMKEYFNK